MHRVQQGCVLGWLTLALLACTPTPAVETVEHRSDPLATAVYKLQNACYGHILDVLDGSAADGAIAIIGADVGGASQQWKLQPSARTGATVLVAQHSGKALDILSDNPPESAPVGQWTTNGTPRQDWVVKHLANGWYRISPVSLPHRSLSIERIESAPGGRLVLRPNGDACDQIWKPIPLSVSGEPLPVGDLPGWKQIFTDDFLVDAPRGSFPGAAYSGGWKCYDVPWRDTSGNGHYSAARTLSVKDGLLTINVRTEDGIPWVSAPQPMRGQSQTYGRYSVRFRATQVTSGYKTAWLLWPQSEEWPDDGEIDFPEGRLNSTIEAFMHYADPDGGQDAFGTDVPYTGWHTATTEWSPGKVEFILDGKVIGTSTTKVPSKPMRWVLQTETRLSGGRPSPDSVGNIEIDWVAIWARQ